ncbi:hypothetical protein NDU88_001286 [Pleurodeles waltl]|uniref:Uncharacterized protein n=1 Tax=Pleurodeles waltl TaxID=8319 RepID=A0AAV7U5Y9_PLEWA|nr:hypothetical protein NDU88_001286 [Pleurodeles waltl]
MAGKNEVSGFVCGARYHEFKQSKNAFSDAKDNRVRDQRVMLGLLPGQAQHHMGYGLQKYCKNPGPEEFRGRATSLQT